MDGHFGREVYMNGKREMSYKENNVFFASFCLCGLCEDTLIILRFACARCDFER